MPRPYTGAAGPVTPASLSHAAVGGRCAPTRFRGNARRVLSLPGRSSAEHGQNLESATHRADAHRFLSKTCGGLSCPLDAFPRNARGVVGRAGLSVAGPTIENMIESLASAGPDRSAGAAGEVPLERLEARICALAGHLAAATCQFLLLIADFDARRGWASWELPSCSAWLAWKCQVAPGTAREHVRVARALRELPVISAEFAAGRMSYAKVRALTRIAAADTDAGLAELAGPMTAAQLERFVAAHRRVTRAEDERARLGRGLSYRVDDDGQLTMTVRLPAAEGATVLQALRAAAGDIPDPAGSPADSPAGLVDGLVGVASAYLGEKAAAAANADVYQVVVHVGADVLAGSAGEDSAAADAVAAGRPVGHPADPARCHLEDGPAVSPATAQRIACQATVSWMLHDHEGNVLDVGRRHRRPPPALRRAVRERDGYRCQYPGCNSRRTDIHHIVPWARGGATRLANLASFCQAHHVIIHELGLVVGRATGGALTVALADGTPVPASPHRPGGDGDLSQWHDAAITESTIVPSALGDTFDLHQTIWACLANAGIAAEQRQAQQLAA